MLEPVAADDSMYLGYNTNGCAHHRLEDALDILAELGYGGVGLTLDHHHLDPFASDWAEHIEQLRRRLEERKLRCVIETGARFLLDPRRKHQPTLVSPTAEERQRRFDFLCQAIVIARDLNADAVSFWSGTPVDEAPDEVLWDRLMDSCLRLTDYASPRNVALAFEPEPGMFIDTIAKFAALFQRVSSRWLGLTLDVGHVHCQNEGPIVDHIQAWKDVLWNVHIEDMRRGVHEHLLFGEGEIDFPPVLTALREIGYAGGVFVELSRHSHDAVNVARKSLGFLQGC